jgi:hypothetical protein
MVPLALKNAGASRIGKALRRWALELDRVAFRVRQIDRRSFALRPVPRFGRARADSEGGKMRSNVFLPKWVHPKTEMIDIAAFDSGWPATSSAQLSSHRNQINHRSTSPQLYEADLVLPTLNGAPQNTTVKAKHDVQIDDAKYQMVDFTNLHDVRTPEVSSDAAFHVRQGQEHEAGSRWGNSG